MDVKRILNAITADRDYRGQLVHAEVIPPREAQYAEPAEPIHPRLTAVLREMGIERLYTHQAAAIDAVRAGENLAIVTSTASGKTLCYNVPVIEALLGDPEARALYVFPTKALAQDQLKTLKRLLEIDPHLPIVAGTYDGDTPPDERRSLRDRGNVILTNPDMLHSGILPHHSRWADFFERLRYVVLDEMHIYRGVFGSNVANVVRRLRRICRHYGSNPVFVCCSATIANPGELAEKLIGLPVTVIGEELDGSPRGRKTFVLWNPPFLDDAKLERRSAHTEAERLMTRLVRDGCQTICFVRARVVSELIYRYVQDSLRRHGHRWTNAVRAYRGGYMAEDRREIERMLFSGELLGVCSTNALELGIDIGSLDACLIVGYPGSIASTRQQSGRAGRGLEDSLTAFIAYNSPIDQFLMQNPRYLFGQSPESAIVDPHNPHVLAWHLRCAARELPLSALDEEYFGELMYPILAILTEDRQTIRRGNQWFWAAQGYPARDFSLRNVTDNVYQIIDEGADPPQTIGQIDEQSAFHLIHDQAIYMHQAETYFVRELNLQRKHAYVHKVDVDYFTQAVSKSDIRVDTTEREKRWRVAQVGFGDLTVTEIVHMFRKIKFGSRDSIGFGNLSLPPQELETCGLWIKPPVEALQLVRGYGRVPQDGLLGIGNVMVDVMPLFVMSDPMDVGSSVDSSNFGGPVLFIYDKYPGGLGLAERAFEKLDEIMEACLSLIHNCQCQDGCLSCVGSPLPPFAQADADASTRGTIPDKEAALCILHYLLQREPYIPRPADPARLEAMRASQGAAARGAAAPPIVAQAEAVPPPPTEFKRLPESVEAKIRRRLRQLRK